MTDVFISYASTDEPLARYIHDHLVNDKVSAFLAAISVRPGMEWEPHIRANLWQSPWVFFLASRAACQSAYVQQEMGGAWVSSKKIVPVVWEMDPKELPGFLSKYHALDLRRSTVEHLQAEISSIAGQIKAEKLGGLFALGAMVAGAIWLGSQE